MYVYTDRDEAISLTEDAYERLKRHKREGESFSDVVTRLAGEVTLSDYYGALDDETADDLERVIASRRESRSVAYRERVEGTTADIEE